MPDSRSAHRLDRGLLIGGPLLSLVAGYVNVVVLMAFAVPVSHVTGSVAHLALDEARHDVSHLQMAVAMLLAFVAGAAVTGYVIEGPMLQHRRRYGLMFVVQGMVFAAAAWCVGRGQWLAVPVAALGCGMQNALATSYRGLNLRTTHMTGIVTDIGVMLGLRARGHRIRRWRLVLLLLIFAGYVAGTFLGVAAVHALPRLVLYLPAVACVAAGLAYAGGYRRFAGASSA